MPLRSPSPFMLAAGHSARLARRLLLAVLLVTAAAALVSASARAATGHELREVSKIAYGSPADGGELSTVYNAANRRPNEISRVAGDPARQRLFLVTRPYTDGTVRVYRVDLDGTGPDLLSEATIVARNNFAAARNAVVDPKDGHLWVLIQDAANALRLLRVAPDDGEILANLSLPSSASSLQAAPMRIDPVGDRLWLASSRYVANIPLDAARAPGATEANFRLTDLRARQLYYSGVFPSVQMAAAGVAFAHDDRVHGGGTGPWTYVATQVPAGLLWISDQTAADLANPALSLTATPAVTPDGGQSEGTAYSMAVDPVSGDILQAIETPNDGNYGRIVRLARDTRRPVASATPGVADPRNGQFHFVGDEVWWRGPGETMILDRTTLEPRATVPNLPTSYPAALAESEMLLDGNLYVPVGDGVSVREMVEVEIPDATATSIGGRRITAGAIEWGVRQSWRQYILKGAAVGQADLTAPATAPAGADPAGASYAYRFPEGEGVYDPASEELRLATKGGVRFTGHYSGGTPVLDVRFSDPTVIVRRDGTALLTANGRDSEGNELGNWPFVDLDLTDVTVVRDGDARTVTYTAVPTALRYDGQPIFQNNYSTGSAFDPITFSFTYHESETTTWDPATTPQTRNGVPVDPKNPNPDPGPGPGPGSGPGTPSAPDPVRVPDAQPTPKPARAAIHAARKRQQLDRQRRVRVATIACPQGTVTCRIAAPKRVAVQIGTRRYGAAVAAPAKLPAGRSATIRATLPKAAARNLEGHTTRLRLRIQIRGEQTTTQTVTIVVRR